jgi:L-lactate dehydrogenase complex protein LldE
LYVTCLVDLFRPVVGFAAIKLLQEAGCEVLVPLDQTCCGQPAYNSGDRSHAQALALQVIDHFEGFDYVVAPSGSCAGMLKIHYPELFKDDPVQHQRAVEFSARVYELTSFLVDIRGLRVVEADFVGRITYHDACAGLRELGVKQQPRQLLGAMQGVEVQEMADSEACCGFGGTFCVKYPEISTAMVGKKSLDIAKTDAEVLLAGDLGCLMNMAGKLSRDRQKIEVRHIAEVLAGMCEEPPIVRMPENREKKAELQ